MLIDLVIVLLSISALYRGREIGFLRQLGSTVGFFGGLFLGAWLEPHTVNLVHSQAGRSAVTLVITLGFAMTLLIIGEYIGLRLKRKVLFNWFNQIDNGLGAALGVISLLISTWLIVAIMTSLPSPSVQSALRSSRIVRALNSRLPAAPNIISDLSRLIDPNGFPQVFIGNEPAPPSSSNAPPSSDFQAGIAKDRASVVKVEGQGCGGIVTGSGFVIASGRIATNAHVVAGIRQPFVQDAHGIHSAKVVWFDPELDFAVLEVSNLNEPSLTILNAKVDSGTSAAALGYPGGGGFTADGATILDEFTARGRDIYGRGTTDRSVYEIQADIIPGNSGGPLILADGTVVGVVFAQSTSYQHVGYSLTTDRIVTEIARAAASDQEVSTGKCAE